MLLAWPGVLGRKSYFINGWVGKNEGGGVSIKMGGGEGVRTCLQNMAENYVFKTMTLPNNLLLICRF